MGNRKGLNNVLYGDRSDIRAAHASSSSSTAVTVSQHGTKGKTTPMSGNSKPWEDDLPMAKNWSSGSSGKSSGHVSCYHTHPALPLPGTDKVVYGSNYQNPIVKDADIYISFQSGMPVWPGMPWERDAPIQIEAPIPDMGVPKDADQFKHLVQWAKSEIDSGKKLHGACIGGHGRTGMFLAALVSLYGEEDAITYVRKNYCTRAVESKVQVEFLHQHFGIKKVEGAKENYSYKSSGSSSQSSSRKNPNVEISKFEGTAFTHLESNGMIWGRV